MNAGLNSNTDYDLNTELRNIHALYTVTLQLEHGVKGLSQNETYEAFSPSRFVYAFFTFNCIYSFDWKNSFANGRAIRWEETESAAKEQACEVCSECGNRQPFSEVTQFKDYLQFVSDTLGDEAPAVFASAFVEALDPSNLNPREELKHIKVQNGPKHMKNAKDHFYKVVALLCQNKVQTKDFYPEMCKVARFIYGVRCNLFHGRKTIVNLRDSAQQNRLEVLAALLVATNSLLFKAASTLKPDWREIDYQLPSRKGELFK